MMTEAEKILEGMRRCMPVTESDGELGCDTCPYSEQCGGESLRIPVAMLEDIRRTLKTGKFRKPRRQTLADIARIIDEARDLGGYSKTDVSNMLGKSEGYYGTMLKRIADPHYRGPLRELMKIADAVDVDIVALRRPE